eukprot:TRINITY_DN19785_c2_g2_i2.p1 TRINITY_DN19785_c2_g2~~TRINITY_DN19785_c2_g2_i2.p1  ORF type:complete len:5756 (+),score=1106.05 TRINITY_DN19785_c2_g2_i2:62-17269(+)
MCARLALAGGAVAGAVAAEGVLGPAGDRGGLFAALGRSQRHPRTLAGSTGAAATSTFTFTLPTGTQTFTLPSVSATLTFTLPSGAATASATYTIPTPSTTPSGSATLPTLTPERNTATLPTSGTTDTSTLSLPYFTDTVTVTLPTLSETPSATSTMPTATATVSGSWSLPDQSATRTGTVTVPTTTLTVTSTGTATLTRSATVSATLPTLTHTPSDSSTLPTLTGSGTSTVTASLSATLTPSATLPTSSLTGTATVTLPSATQTVGRTISLPTATPSSTGSVTLPSLSPSATVSTSLPTATTSSSRSTTLPSVTTSLSETFTLATGTPSLSSTITLPSVTLTTSTTFTIPAATATMPLSFTVPTATVTRSSTLTLPTVTASLSASFTLRTRTSTASSTSSLPTASASRSGTLSLPTLTPTRSASMSLASGTATGSATASLPTRSGTATATVTLPAASVSASGSVTLPPATASRTATSTLPTTSASFSPSYTLPSASSTATRTYSLPTHTVSRSATATLPALTGSATASASLPSISVSSTWTLTLPTLTSTVSSTLSLLTVSASKTASATLPTTSQSQSASLSLPTWSGAPSASATLPSASSTRSLTLSLPTLTPTPSPSVSLPTDSRSLTATVTLPPAAFTQTRTFTLPTRTSVPSTTFALPTATATPQGTETLPTASATIALTFSLPTITSSSSATFTLPSATEARTATLTIPSSSGTPTVTATQSSSATLPSLTLSIPLTATLPSPTPSRSRSVSLTATVTASLSLPTQVSSTTRTLTLPSLELSETATYTFPTPTATPSPEFTLPTATPAPSYTAELPSASATQSATLSLPTLSATREATATLPSVTATATASYSLPTLTSPATATLPSATATASGSVTASATATLPTAGATITATLSLPGATGTETGTGTLPTGSGTATQTLTLPGQTETQRATVTLPTATVTATVTVTLPTSSLPETGTLTLPSASATLTETVSLPTQMLTATETFTLPTLSASVTGTASATGSATATVTATVSLPSETRTATQGATFTLPTLTATVTEAVTLPTATETRTLTLPTLTVTLPSATLSRSAEVTLPTRTATATTTLALSTASRSSTLSLPAATGTATLMTRTASRTATATLPTRSATATAALPSASGSATQSATLPAQTGTGTLPSATDTATRTITLPERTRSSTVSVPSASRSDTGTGSLPTATRSATLPEGTGTGTRTVTLPSGTDSATVSFPSATATRTETAALPTATETRALPTRTLTATETLTLPTQTDSATLSLPSAPTSETLTETLPAATATVTLPSRTSADTATLTLQTRTGTGTATLPSSSVSETLTTSLPAATVTRTLPSLTESGARSLTLPSASGSATLTLATASGTRTASATLPTRTGASTATLPTATQTATLASRTASATRSASLPSGSASGSATLPSGTTSATATATGTASGTDTWQAHGSYSQVIEPPEFVEGQEVRLRIIPHLLLATGEPARYPQLHVDAADYGGLRVQVLRAGGPSDCTAPRAPGDVLWETAEVGLSDADTASGVRWVAAAHATFAAPSSSTAFFVCFQHTLDPTRFRAPHNGEWQPFLTQAGEAVFRARPAGAFFELVRPSAGQFTTVRVVSREPWDFTLSPGPPFCAMDAGAGAPTTTPGCGVVDNAKLVPAGAPCTFERTWRSPGAPGDRYWGSAWAEQDGRPGAWQAGALRGLLEGALPGTVGAVGSRYGNPFAASSPPSAAPQTAPRVAYLYTRMPDTPGRYELCFSAAQQRALLVGLNATLDSLPLWRKLFPCATAPTVAADGTVGGCLAHPGEGASFWVPPETITWDAFDLSPGTWGALRVDGGGVPLSIERMAGDIRDGWGPAGGDWLRLAPAEALEPGNASRQLADSAGTAGSMPGPGCWYEGFNRPAALGAPGGWADESAVRPLGTRQLIGDPTQAGDPGTEHAFATVWIPEDPMLVCYRLGGSPAWGVLRRRAAQGRWAPPLPPAAPSAELSPSASDPVALLLHISPPAWEARDSRRGTHGSVAVLPPAGAATPLDSRPWDLTRSYAVGEAVGATAGSALRLVPEGRPCDWPGAGALVARGGARELTDGGLIECGCGGDGDGVCGSRGADEEAARAVAYYLHFDVPPGRYRVCWRYRAWNWRELRAGPLSAPEAVASDWVPSQGRPSDFLVVRSALLPRLALGGDAALVPGTEVAFVINDSWGDLTALPLRCDPPNSTRGDILALLPAAAPCSLFEHVIARDAALSPVCSDPAAPSAPCGPCGGLECAPLDPAQRAALAESSPAVWGDVVPGDGPGGNLSLAFASLRIPARAAPGGAKLCYSQATAPGWVELAAVRIAQPAGMVVHPASGERVLLGGSLQRLEATWPARGAIRELRGRMVRVEPAGRSAEDTDEGSCAAPPGGTETAPFAAASADVAFRRSGGNVSADFTMVVPQEAGAYWLCVMPFFSGEVPPLPWHRVGPYTVLDNGVRWYVDTARGLTNMATARVRLVRTDAESRKHTAYWLDPVRDAAQVLRAGPQQHCGSEAAEHVSTFPAPNAPLRALTGDATITEVVVTLPPVPGDVSTLYRVCVLSSFLQLNDGRPAAERRMWVEAAQGVGLPQQRYAERGFLTAPGGVSHWELRDWLSPHTSYLPDQLPLKGPSALTGASTEGASAPVGFRITARPGAVGPPGLSFKLVRVVSPLSPEPTLGRHWAWGHLRGALGCLGSPVHLAASEGQCGGGAARCPELRRSGDGFDAVFTMPSAPGGFALCVRNAAGGGSEPGPWLHLPATDGSLLLYTEPSLLGFTAPPSSGSSPVHSAAITDAAVGLAADGELRPLFAWCGGGGAEGAAACAGRDLARVVPSSEQCPAPPGASAQPDPEWKQLESERAATAALLANATGAPVFPPAQGLYSLCLYKAGDPGAGARHWVAKGGVVYRLLNRGRCGVRGDPAAYEVLSEPALQMCLFPRQVRADAVRLEIDWQGLAERARSTGRVLPGAATALLAPPSDPRWYFDPSVSFSAGPVDADSYRYLPPSALVATDALGPVSAPVVTSQDWVSAAVTAVSNGTGLRVGAFPFRVVLCRAARSWTDGSLSCRNPVRSDPAQGPPQPFLIVGGGGPEEGLPAATDAAGVCPPDLAWSSDGLQSSTTDGSATLNLQLRSGCPSNTGLPNPCCGFALEMDTGGGGAVRSEPVWLCVEGHYPDMLAVDGRRLTPDCGGCVAARCESGAPCAMRLQALRRWAVEYNPRGGLQIAVGGGAASFTPGSWSPVSGADWLPGGYFVYNTTPSLLEPVDTGNVQLTVLFGDGAGVSFRVVVSRPQPAALRPLDVAPIGPSVSSHNRVPVPVWFAADADTGAAPSELSAAPGAHLEALAPYELQYEVRDAGGRALGPVATSSWTIRGEVRAGGVAVQGNALFSVLTDPGGDPSPSNFLSAAQLGSPLPKQALEQAGRAAGPGGAGGRHRFRLRFRVRNSLGCSRFAGGCGLVFLLERDGRGALAAAVRTPVRVPASGVRVEARVAQASLSDGIEVTVSPGTWFAHRWLQDEWHFGGAFALADSADGLRTQDGVALDQGWGLEASGIAFTLPEHHAMRELGDGAWGARWTLRPVAPCFRCHVSFHTSWGAGAAPGSSAHSLELTWDDDTVGLGCAAHQVHGGSAWPPRPALFRVEVWAARAGGGRANWPGWTVRLNATADGLRLGGAPVARMRGGTAEFAPLSLSADYPAAALRAWAVVPTYSTAVPGSPVAEYREHSCTAVVTATPAGAPAARAVRLRELQGAELLCEGAACELGECARCAVRVPLGARAAFTAHVVATLPGGSDSSTVADSVARNLTIFVAGQPVPPLPCTPVEALCTAGAELPTPGSPVRGLGAAAEYSSGVARVSFEWGQTSTSSAPDGSVTISMLQSATSEPVRNAAFDICAAHSLAAGAHVRDARVACLTVALYIAPSSPPPPSVAITASGGLPSNAVLLIGGAECAMEPTRAWIDAVAYYTLSISGRDKHFLVYDTPLRFQLHFRASGDRAQGERPIAGDLLVDNALPASAPGDSHTLDGAGGTVRLHFTAVSEVPEAGRAPFRVSLAQRLPDGSARPLATAATPRTYYFAYGSGPGARQWQVRDAPRATALCSPGQRMAAEAHNYRVLEPVPGKGWPFRTGMRVGVLTPVQTEVLQHPATWEAPGWPPAACAAAARVIEAGIVSEGQCKASCEDLDDCAAVQIRGAQCALLLGPVAMAGGGNSTCRVWLIRRGPRSGGFPPSLIRLRKYYDGGCGTGGQMRVFEPRGAASVLLGTQGSFRELPPDAEGWAAQRTEAGAATSWVVFDEPCERCRIMLDLCYPWAASASECFAGNNTSEGDNHVATRSITTAPFNITPSRPSTVVVTDQYVGPTPGPATVGEILHVSLHTVETFGRRRDFGGWAMDAVEQVETRVHVVSEWIPGADSTPDAYYANGGFLAPAPDQSAPCRLPLHVFQQAARHGTVAEGSVYINARFTYTRPCASCAVRVHYSIALPARPAHAAGSFRLRAYSPLGGPAAPGQELRLSVRTCGIRWLAVHPRLVFRRAPFTVGVWWVDRHGMRTWDSNATVAVRAGGDHGNGGGGELLVSSPGAEITQGGGAREWAVPAVGGSGAVRMEYTRACFACSIVVGGAAHSLTVWTAPTQVIVTRVQGAERARFVRGVPLNLTLDLFAADDLGDRAYGVGGPEPLAWAAPHGPAAPPGRLQPRLSPAHTLQIGGVTLTDGAPSVTLLSHEAVHGGVPAGPDRTRMGGTGTAAVLLAGSPCVGAELQMAVAYGSVSLPTRLFGSPRPPVIDWPPAARRAAVQVSWGPAGLVTAPGAAFAVTVYAVGTAGEADVLYRSAWSAGTAALAFNCSECPGCALQAVSGEWDAGAGRLTGGFVRGAAALAARFRPGSDGWCTAEVLPPAELLGAAVAGPPQLQCDATGCAFPITVDPRAQQDPGPVTGGPASGASLAPEAAAGGPGEVQTVRLLGGLVCGPDGARSLLHGAEMDCDTGTYLVGSGPAEAAVLAESVDGFGVRVAGDFSTAVQVLAQRGEQWIVAGQATAAAGLTHVALSLPPTSGEPWTVTAVAVPARPLPAGALLRTLRVGAPVLVPPGWVGSVCAAPAVWQQPMRPAVVAAVSGDQARVEFVAVGPSGSAWGCAATLQNSVLDPIGSVSVRTQAAALGVHIRPLNSTRWFNLSSRGSSPWLVSGTGLELRITALDHAGHPVPTHHGAHLFRPPAIPCANVDAEAGWTRSACFPFDTCAERMPSCQPGKSWSVGAEVFQMRDGEWRDEVAYEGPDGAAGFIISGGGAAPFHGIANWQTPAGLQVGALRAEGRTPAQSWACADRPPGPRICSHEQQPPDARPAPVWYDARRSREQYADTEAELLIRPRVDPEAPFNLSVSVADAQREPVRGDNVTRLSVGARCLANNLRLRLRTAAGGEPRAAVVSGGTALFRDLVFHGKCAQAELSVGCLGAAFSRARCERMRLLLESFEVGDSQVPGDQLVMSVVRVLVVIAGGALAAASAQATLERAVLADARKGLGEDVRSAALRLVCNVHRSDASTFRNIEASTSKHCRATGGGRRAAVLQNSLDLGVLSIVIEQRAGARDALLRTYETLDAAARDPNSVLRARFPSISLVDTISTPAPTSDGVWTPGPTRSPRGFTPVPGGHIVIVDPPPVASPQAWEEPYSPLHTAATPVWGGAPQMLEGGGALRPALLAPALAVLALLCAVGGGGVPGPGQERPSPALDPTSPRYARQVQSPLSSLR